MRNLHTRRAEHKHTHTASRTHNHCHFLCAYRIHVKRGSVERAKLPNIHTHTHAHVHTLAAPTTTATFAARTASMSSVEGSNVGTLMPVRPAPASCKTQKEKKKNDQNDEKKKTSQQKDEIFVSEERKRNNACEKDDEKALKANRK